MFHLTNILFHNVILFNEQQFKIGRYPSLLRPLLFSDAYLLEASKSTFFFEVATSIHSPEEKVDFKGEVGGKVPHPYILTFHSHV